METNYYNIRHSKMLSSMIVVQVSLRLPVIKGL